MLPTEIEPNAARAVAAQCLLKAYHLPSGVRTLIGYLLATEAPPTVARIAQAMDCSDRTISLWIRRAKRIGLLTVERQGRRNRYEVNLQQLQHLAERGGS